MADALVSAVLEHIASITLQETEREVILIVGVRNEVKNLNSTLRSIQAVLVDAEKRRVTDAATKDWLDELKDTSYDINDVLDEWSTANLKLKIKKAENANSMPKKVCFYISLPRFCFNRVVLRRNIARKMKNLNERLDAIGKNKDRYSVTPIRNNIEELKRPKSTSFIDVSKIHGLDQDKNIIVSKLLCESSHDEKGFHIISVVGKGGIGKTTLAQQAYNDADVDAHFDKKIWICVSDPFDEEKIAIAIVRELKGSDRSSLRWENLPKQIHESIMGEKFLLVLDDVWTEDFKRWEPLQDSLKSGAQGSRILVTTRNERVAKMMGTTYIHSLEELSMEACWSLFSQIAFFGKSKEDCKNLEEIGRKISYKCKGLPLAAKTLGSLMRFKNTEREWWDVHDSDIWKMKDPMIMEGLFSPLLLSYYDLPSPLKQCFLYCATFPKDSEIWTRDLIQLWMAEDYLHSNESTEMELIGREYFDNLVMRSFFQDFKKDWDNIRIVGCKMHDIVHDFAQLLTENECSIMEFYGEKESSIDLSYLKGRHLTLILGPEVQFPNSIYRRKNLRTLIVEPTFGYVPICNALPNLFRHLKCLRALNLRKRSIEEVPREVGNLMHLRYLNLSCNSFKKLPETVCDLCNLQTLILTYCFSLEELPKGMGRLINLRYLDIFGTELIRVMPKGIGRLSSLRTLIEFIVSGGDDDRDREGCKLEDLKNLKNLRCLKIKGLGNVENASEAKEAELKSIGGLDFLILNFSPEGTRGNIEEDVIEALQPQPKLERLEICNYSSTQFPNWMMSLTRLRKLELHQCDYCVRLPPLGKLPSLESLKIWSSVRLKKVGFEFLGLENSDDDYNATMGKDIDGAKVSPIIAFPKLKNLEFHFMDEWEEWEDWNEITVMPCLHSLSFAYCPRLKTLPHHLSTPRVKKTFNRSPFLEQRYKEG